VRRLLSIADPVSPQARRFAGAVGLVADLTLAAVALMMAIVAWAPPQDLPWTPLSLDAPIGLATHWKFERAAAHLDQCRQILQQAGVAFQVEPDRRMGACDPLDTLRLTDGALTPLQPAGPLMSCPLALGYAFWTRHSLQPAAQAMFGESVVGIEHVGTFACRNIYNEVDGRRSEHAFANALDVTGFRLASGRRVTVGGDFRGVTPGGAFLHAARTGACAWFHVVLSPDYNRQHASHFHVDQGRNEVCR
jgi:hypothetical protein